MIKFKITETNQYNVCGKTGNKNYIIESTWNKKTIFSNVENKNEIIPTIKKLLKYNFPDIISFPKIELKYYRCSTTVIDIN